MKKAWTTLLILAVTVAAVVCVRTGALDAEAAETYFAGLTADHQSVITSGNYEYRLSDDHKTIIIAKYTGEEAVIEIPSEIDGYRVSEIGEGAFRYQEMKSLSVPDSISCIGRQAFEYCVVSDLLRLPENITIEEDAFSYAELPPEVTIPAGAAVNTCAFSYCEKTKLLSIDPGAVIKSSAFSYCEDLVRVVCAGGSRLEKKAFEYCGKLEEAIFCGDVETEDGTFSYCDKVKITEAEESAYETWTQSGSEIPLSGIVSEEWEPTVDTSVTEEAQDVFDRAMPDHDRVDYEAVALLATQSADGTNYCFLRRTGVTDSDEKPSYQLAYIREDPDGNVHVLEVKDIEIGLSDGAEPSPDDVDEINLEILGSPASQDGVTVTLEKAEAERSDTGGFEYSFSGTIENDSDEGIMQVVYTFALIDENGEQFRSFGEVFDGEEEAIAPHTKIEFSHDGIKWGPQSVPASVKIDISSVKTEAELPPARVPQTGEFLYQALGDEKLANIKEEPPVALSFHIDQGGYGRTAAFEKGGDLDQAVELLCDIKIGEESGEWVTDNYNWIRIDWEDGSYTRISLNLRNLEYYVHSTPHTYQLENLDAFWSFAAGFLKED
ncbi:MAG: leucine-rich repeat domain-containing protein [Eubacteriales bacterium]|nr:leucine-rich repeat domain-containing protein [Eubacteriales bacterium]